VLELSLKTLLELAVAPLNKRVIASCTLALLVSSEVHQVPGGGALCCSMDRPLRVRVRVGEGEGEGEGRVREGEG
jgi:hypothetical protein